MVLYFRFLICVRRNVWWILFGRLLSRVFILCRVFSIINCCFGGGVRFFGRLVRVSR